jgi:hypothetical protein
MISLLGRPRRFCDGLTRRDALRAGSLAMLGASFGLPALPDAKGAQDSGRRAKAKSVIFLFLHGGAPTQDMFDLKPDAPPEVRGEFKPIASSAPGVRVCEYLPRTAKWMHRAAVVRSVNHRAGCHNTLPTFTGYAEPIPDISSANPNHPPSMGSVCEYLRKDPGGLPAYVCLPTILGYGDAARRPGIYAGFLGQRYDPFISEVEPYVDPAHPKPYLREHPPVVQGLPRIPNGVLVDGITLDRLNRRQDLVGQLDAQLRRAEGQAALAGYERTRGRAFDLLTSAKLRAAFDLEREPPRLRDRYGRQMFGQSCLIARKLVQSGVRFVNVFWEYFSQRLGIPDFGWDTHEKNFILLRDHFLPWLDGTYAALLEDLDRLGMLDETLVVLISDFGRTPNVNKDAGRDHWTYCYSVVFAGAGVRGGTLYGASDKHAAFVRDNPVSPADVCATIYECLGIDPEMPVHDRTGRPVPVALGGKPIRDILA